MTKLRKKKKKRILIKLINTDSINNNYLSTNKINDSVEKRNRRIIIPHSKYSKIESTKNLKNINFCDIKSIIEKRKNYTPYLKRQSLKSDKSNHIEKNISSFNINNEEKGNIKVRNRSPFYLRHIFNFSLGNIDIKNDIKIEYKNEENNKYKNKNDKKEENKKNLFYLRLKSSDNVEKNNRNKKDNLNINSNNSFLISSSVFSSENSRNRSREIIRHKKQKEKERINLLSQREVKIKKYIFFNNNNLKNKSEDKIITENKENNKEKYKKRIKPIKEEKSLKPKDIVEPSKIDLSRDITIINESIQNDKKLYQDIQFKVKKILSKGRLPQFFLENYTVTKQLGEGSFGTIFEAYNNETRIKYAIKKIIANSLTSLEKYQKEFEIVYENKHPNILDIYGVCIRCLDATTYVLYVLMDKAEKDWETEINERAKVKKYYTEKELISIIKQIVNALCYLQKEKKIAHRDIKPENILLFKNNICKIADFGEAKKSIDNKFRTLRGTEFYMSPILYNNLKNKNEFVRHNPYKSDVFSLGYCIVCATALNFNIVEKIRGKNVSEIKKIFNQYFLKIYSNKFVELILKMIEYFEEKRVDFVKLNEILQKDF